jgi:hypothetical protein
MYVTLSCIQYVHWSQASIVAPSVLFCRPVAGSKTDIRGKRAHTHINKEVLQLCQLIYENGEPIEDMTEDGRNQIVISFGELFQVHYNTQLNWPYITEA